MYRDACAVQTGIGQALSCKGHFLGIRLDGEDFQLALFGQLIREPTGLRTSDKAEAFLDAGFFQDVIRRLLVDRSPSIFGIWCVVDRIRPDHIDFGLFGIRENIDFSGRGTRDNVTVRRRQSGDVALNLGVPSLFAGFRVECVDAAISTGDHQIACC